MTERRPHWDDDLIEAVNDAMENNAYHDEMVYAVIAAVEDRQALRLGACVPQLAAWQYEKQTIPLWHWAQAEAAIERVRGIPEKESDVGYPNDWHIGWNACRESVLDALDGDA